jgi:hypothetical protein
MWWVYTQAECRVGAYEYTIGFGIARIGGVRESLVVHSDTVVLICIGIE